MLEPLDIVRIFQVGICSEDYDVICDELFQVSVVGFEEYEHQKSVHIIHANFRNDEFYHAFKWEPIGEPKDET